MSIRRLKKTVSKSFIKRMDKDIKESVSRYAKRKKKVSVNAYGSNPYMKDEGYTSVTIINPKEIFKEDLKDGPTETGYVSTGTLDSGTQWARVDVYDEHLKEHGIDPGTATTDEVLNII